MADEVASMGGADRAAVLLLSMGEAAAAQVLKHMSPREVQALGMAMAKIQNVSQSVVDGVLEEFLRTIGQHSSLGIDSKDYVRSVLVQALGETKASSLADRILVGGNPSGLETLKWMEPKAVAEMLRNEHPQVVAIVLSYLEREHAAGIMGHLPDSMRVDLLMRISKLDSVQPAAIRELNALFENQISGKSNVQLASVGGIKYAADILNFVGGGVEAQVMEGIKEVDPDLGQQIQDLMFVFDNLIDLDGAAVQGLLREVSSDSLLIALKGTDERMRQKFFSNMSKRAAEMMQEDLEAKGPVRLSEVEAAQKEIVGIARRMAEEGQITLGGKGADEYI